MPYDTPTVASGTDTIRFTSMATPFEYRVMELTGEVKGDSFTLDFLELDSKLREQRAEGWELASTGVSVQKLSPFAVTQTYVIRVTYGLKRLRALNPVDRNARVLTVRRPPTRS